MEEQNPIVQSPPVLPQETKKPNSFKLISLVLTFLIVFIAIVTLFSLQSGNKKIAPSTTQILPTSSTKSAVFIDFVNPTGVLIARQDVKSKVTVKGSDANKKISGFQFTFTTAGGAEIKNIEAFRPDHGQLTTIQKKVGPKQASIVAVVLDKAVNLPTELAIEITFAGAQPGQGSLKLDMANAKVTGPVKENSYSLTQVNESNFSFK